jgi:hypothetical protein
LLPAAGKRYSRFAVEFLFGIRLLFGAVASFPRYLGSFNDCYRRCGIMHSDGASSIGFDFLRCLRNLTKSIWTFVFGTDYL